MAEHLTERFSATVDPEVLAAAKRFAAMSGFRHSFSAYLNDLLQRDNAHRQQALSRAMRQSTQEHEKILSEPLLPFQIR